ncbi:hypothetical protein ANANG_G00136150 [Anguilla anguilla]|uniref:Uncharacterized protein n=1 Tax=Anguilla anguilla TaxID=7936 RepID=A0A9D3MDA6_ANGAN|nr:hypothetical protein ANANG_G00136150 [Anguilla anguilla]
MTPLLPSFLPTPPLLSSRYPSPYYPPGVLGGWQL